MFISLSGSTDSKKFTKTVLKTGDIVFFQQDTNCICAARGGNPLMFSLNDDKFQLSHADFLVEALRLISDLYDVTLKKVPKEKYGNGSNEVWEVTERNFIEGRGYTQADTV
jgi:hypothetical protein